MTASALFGVVDGERSRGIIPDIRICQCGLESGEMDRLVMDSDCRTCECGTHDGETITTPTSMDDEGGWTQVAASEGEVFVRSEFAEPVD